MVIVYTRYNEVIRDVNKDIPSSSCRNGVSNRRCIYYNIPITGGVTGLTVVCNTDNPEEAFRKYDMMIAQS